VEEVVVEAFACLGAFALFLRVSGFFAGGEPFVGNFVGATGAPVALAREGGTTIVGSAKAQMRRKIGSLADLWVAPSTAPSHTNRSGGWLA